jgi:SP family facilitated glucose transporter-like MFS transporter 8
MSDLFVQDSSFLFMGRLLEGFGVGVISYVVCLPLLLIL